MSDQDLRAAARDLEHDVALPDFAEVAARGHRLRRRRQSLRAAVVGVVATAAVALGVQLVAGPENLTPPVPVARDDDRPVDVAAVLADPRAVVDDDLTAVSDSGAVLQGVTVGRRADRCTTPDAWVWTPWRRPARTWSDTAGGRVAAAVPGGLVVSAPDPACGSASRDGGFGAYVVDPTGARTAVTWSGRAERVCAVAPADPRCVVDVEAATGRLQPVPRLPAGTLPVVDALGGNGPTVWARSVDSRTVHWSVDGGATWQVRRTSLPVAGDVQVTAAGDRAVFFSYPAAEHTRDAGRTWRTWDGSAALAPFVLAREQLSVSADGDLVVVTHRPGRPPALLASTDETWQQFEEAELRTAFGTVAVSAAGGWFTVPDRGRTWVSPDGTDWRAVDPLGR